jgi:hypothetical protein
MEICFAIFVNVLELDDSGQPANEKYAEAVPRRGFISTALVTCRRASQSYSCGRWSCIDAGALCRAAAHGAYVCRRRIAERRRREPLFAPTLIRNGRPVP